jgi:hypothetical protein
MLNESTSSFTGRKITVQIYEYDAFVHTGFVATEI